MPRRKQWFPVSHDINDDPEIWALTDECGDRSLRVLLEYYRILDKTENNFRDNRNCWLGIFRKCRVYPKNGWKIRDKLVTNGWLMDGHGDVAGFPRICGSPNYWKYHGMQEPVGITWSSLLTKPNQTYSSNKNSKSPVPASPAPSVDSLKLLKLIQKWEAKMASMNLIPELKEIADKIYFFDPVKFKRLAAWIAQGRKYGHCEPDMAETLRRFDKKDRQSVGDWYPYLDSILVKVEADRNRDSSLAEHEQHKAEVREASKIFAVK